MLDAIRISLRDLILAVVVHMKWLVPTHVHKKKWRCVSMSMDPVETVILTLGQEPGGCGADQGNSAENSLMRE